VLWTIIVAVVAAACTSVSGPGLPIDGSYVLDSVSGDGPASGTLVLTHQGYAERRVRFREVDSTLSKEYLARGTVVVHADGALDIELREVGARADDPWVPAARWMGDRVELRDRIDTVDVVEVYRRKGPFRP
jgi:hypothetical protein